MGKPAAKQGDKVVASDTHVLLVPSPAGPVPTPTPMPFNGTLAGALARSVEIEGKAAAVVGSKATNTPPHIPAGGSFQKPPDNQASVMTGSASVLIEDQQAARHGDTATTCNDPAPAPQGSVLAQGSVWFGD